MLARFDLSMDASRHRETAIGGGRRSKIALSGHHRRCRVPLAPAVNGLAIFGSLGSAWVVNFTLAWVRFNGINTNVGVH